LISALEKAMELTTTLQTLPNISPAKMKEHQIAKSVLLEYSKINANSVCLWEHVSTFLYQ